MQNISECVGKTAKQKFVIMKALQTLLLNVKALQSFRMSGT